MGRKKITFDEMQLKQIELLCAYGLTQEEISLLMKVSIKTLQERLYEHGGIDAYYKKGKAKLDAGIIKALALRAKTDTTAAIFYLKTRRHWSTDLDKAVTEAITSRDNRFLEIIRSVVPKKYWVEVGKALDGELDS